LNNGDSIWCTLTAALCTGVVAVQSNVIVVTGSLTPSVSVSVPSDTICSGSRIAFTAVALNAGSAPVYQWKINGITVGSNEPRFESSTLQNGDEVSCLLLTDPSFTCVTVSSVLSNTITMTVTAQESPRIEIFASTDHVCPGTTVGFTAATAFAGSTPGYQWLLNGNSTGITDPTFVSASLENNDRVQCLLTGGASSCGNTPVISNEIRMTVKSIPVIKIQPADTTVTAGTAIHYIVAASEPPASVTWQPQALMMDAQVLSAETLPLYQDVIFTMNAVSSEGCSFQQKAVVKIFRALSMPGAFTPNADGLNDVFRIPPGVNLQLEKFSVYDRWGRQVFSTSDRSGGWDGKFNGRLQSTGLYVYTISGSESGKKLFLKGSFILIR
jgi:gliding motility-associated-like protein